ncbi:hypothetical protein ABVT39_021313 [Epinephelus coioides]
MMSVSIEESLDFDEEQANDLMNSIIDWEKGTLSIEEGKSSDDDFVPSIYIRTGGALLKPFDIEKLTVIGVDETVHGVPESEHPEPDIPEFLDPIKVECEDDLIGKQACIAYEDSLRQLGTFLRLPINKCPYADPITGAECGCSPPFQVKQQIRGTAIIMEWIMWHAVLHHVRGKHQWSFGSCDHGPLDEDSRDKPWMVQGSPAHQALAAIVLDKRWLKDVKKFITFRTKSDLEAFQNHILMYAGKRFAYRPPVYEARTLLAAIDYNHHNNRPAAWDSEGNKMNKRYFNKRTKTCSVYTVKSAKDYSYIPQLQAFILGRQLRSWQGLPKRRSLRPDDPRQLGLLADQPHQQHR